MLKARTETLPADFMTALPDEERADFSRATEKLDAATLQRLYLDEIFRYVVRRVANREEAEDVTAETFVAAFTALPKFRGKVPPKAWLLGIARRQIIDAHRRRKSRAPTVREYSREENDAKFSLKSLQAAVATHRPETIFEREEARRYIRALLNELKEEQREALLLKYVEELSVNEIAVVMKRSPQAINSLLQRARKTLYQRGKDYFLNGEVTR